MGSTVGRLGWCLVADLVDGFEWLLVGFEWLLVVELGVWTIADQERVLATELVVE